MNALAGIGALADGISQGLTLSRDLKMRDQHIEQQRLQMEKQAALDADMKAANEAAAARAKAFQTEHEQQYRGLGAAMRYGGSDGSLTDAGAARLDGQPVPAFQPTKRQMLAVAEARTNELMKRGRMNEAMQLWTQDEGMRAQLRQQAAQVGLQKFKTTGDPTDLLKGVYENIDDGWDMKAVIPGPETQDGVRIFGVERVNQFTGEKRVDEVRSDGIEELVMQAMDPKTAAEYSMRSKLEALKGAEARRTNADRHKLTMKEIAARGENSLTLQDAKTEGAIELQGLKNEAMLDGKRITVDGAITAAKIRAAGGGAGGAGGTANRVQRTLTLDNGQVMVVMKDGTNKILTGDDGKPVRGLDAEKLVASLTRDISKTMEGAMKPYGENRETAKGLMPRPPAAPAKQPLSSFDRVTPQQQSARDTDRLGILRRELAQAQQAGNAADVAALQREIAATEKTLGLSGGRPAARPALDSYLR